MATRFVITDPALDRFFERYEGYALHPVNTRAHAIANMESQGAILRRAS